jgi:hypothetical protein
MEFKPRWSRCGTIRVHRVAEKTCFLIFHIALLLFFEFSSGPTLIGVELRRQSESAAAGDFSKDNCGYLRDVS